MGFDPQRAMRKIRQMHHFRKGYEEGLDRHHQIPLERYRDAGYQAGLEGRDLDQSEDEFLAAEDALEDAAGGGDDVDQVEVLADIADHDDAAVDVADADIADDDPADLDDADVDEGEEE